MDKEEAFSKGIFPVGLYLHIISFPFVILFSSILIFLKIEMKFPKFHRKLGKVTSYILLFVFLPSGIILSFWGVGGMLTTFNFLLLAFLSAYFLLKSLKHIKNGNVKLHQRNMIRMYLLVISAIILRILSFVFGYYFNFRGVEAYQTASILSWTIPLLIYELILWSRRGFSG